MPNPTEPSRSTQQATSRQERQARRQGWVLVLGLVSFGVLAVALFYETFPRGWRGIARGVTLLALMLLLGGVIAPIVSRALLKRR